MFIQGIKLGAGLAIGTYLGKSVIQGIELGATIFLNEAAARSNEVRDMMDTYVAHKNTPNA